MVKTPKIRWGILGTARINRALIEPIRTSKKSQLYAVASRSQSKAIEYAKSWDIPRPFSSYEALLDDPEIDVVYNSLPHSLHVEWSVKAMQMGKHVLCEKPISITVSDMGTLMSTSHNTGRIITEAFMYRHHPQTLMVKEMVDGGEIGEIRLIRGSFCYTNTREGDLRLRPEFGGGSLWDVGCYPISYARYITGKEPISVWGQQVIGPTGVDLFFAGQLQFPGSIIAQFDCSFVTPFYTKMEITGTQGKITIPVPFKPGKREVVLLERGGHEQQIRVKGIRLYSGEVEDIENAILLGTPPRISLEDSMGNIATIDALIKSANQSIPISL